MIAERDFAKEQQTLQQQQLKNVSESNRDELRQEIARLLEANGKLNSRLDDSSRTVKRLESELDHTRSELITAKKAVSIGEQRVEEAMKSSDGHIKRWSEDLVKKESELAKTNEINRTLMSQLETSQQKCLQIEGDLQQASRSNGDRLQQTQQLSEDLREARNEASMLREQVRKLEKKNDQLEHRSLDAERRLNDIQRQLDESSHALQMANKRASGLETTGASPVDTRSLSLLEMRCHELLEAKARLTEDLVRMESAKKASEQDVKHVTARLADAEKRATTAEINFEASQRQVEEQMRKNDRLGDDSRRVQQEIAERNAEVDRLRRELASFHEAASDLVGRSTTQATVSELRTRLKVAEDEMKQREQELNELKQRYEMKEKLDQAEFNKLKQRAEEARGLWEQEVKTKAGVGQMLLEAEKKVDVAENELMQAKTEVKRLEDLLRLADRRYDEERLKVSEMEQKLQKNKAKLQEIKARSVGSSNYDDRLSELSRQLDQQRNSYDDRIAILKKQVEDARRELEHEKVSKDRIDQDRRSLEVKVVKIQSLEQQIQELTRQKQNIENDFSQYRDLVARTYIERSVMDCKIQEHDAKIKAEFDSKIAQFHQSIAELDREREHTDELRLANDQNRSVLYDFEKQQLAEELQRIRAAYNSLLSAGGTTQHDVTFNVPVTSTPISNSDNEVNSNNENQGVSRRLSYGGNTTLNNDSICKVISQTLHSNARPGNYTSSSSFLTSRVLNQSLNTSRTTPNVHRIMSASFQYSLPSVYSRTASGSHRRDLSIESLRAQLDRAVALGLGNRY